MNLLGVINPINKVILLQLMPKDDGERDREDDGNGNVEIRTGGLA
jgi:hypothetical protein